MDKVVVKAILLLELLAASEEPMGITALAAASEMGKSNVHRLLQTLQAMGYARAAGDGSYCATLKMWEMGCQVISRVSMRDVARPFMRELAEVTKETVHLSELDGHEVLYLDKIESSEPVRAYTQLGGRAPAYCTATGKAMLAFESRDRVVACLDGAQRHTAKTIVNLNRLLDELELIRKRRYAVNAGEWRADIIGLASPIAGSDGRVVGAIGISGPSSRLNLHEIDAVAPRTVEYGRLMSLALGCSERAWAALGGESVHSNSNNGTALQRSLVQVPMVVPPAPSPKPAANRARAARKTAARSAARA